MVGADRDATDFAPGADWSDEDAGDGAHDLDGLQGRVAPSHDMRGTSRKHLGGGTRAGEAPPEEYAGEDDVMDRRTFAQHASAECSYRLRWPEADVRVTSTMRVDVGVDGYDVGDHRSGCRWRGTRGPARVDRALPPLRATGRRSNMRMLLTVGTGNRVCPAYQKPSALSGPPSRSP